jgi:hypothetical protein
MALRNPKNYDRRLPCFECTAEMRRAVQAEARRRHCSMGAIIREALTLQLLERQRRVVER